MSYSELLQKIIDTHDFSQVHNEWEQLFPHITQDVLNDAHSKSNMVVNMYKPLVLIPRPCKTHVRVVAKNNEPKINKSFKVNCDFMAFQVKVYDPTNIPVVVESIMKTTTDNGGLSFIRNSIVNAEGNMTDVIQYLYAYIPSIG